MEQRGIHDSFAHIAALQVYKVDTLIARMQSLIEQKQDILQRRQRDFFNVLASGAPFTEDGGRLETDCFVKGIKEAVNAKAVLVALKANGIEILQLDSGRSLYQQVLEQVSEKNCPDFYAQYGVMALSSGLELVRRM